MKNRTVLLCALLLLAASAARATDIGVTGQSLVISDKHAAAGKSKMVFKIKDAARRAPTATRRCSMRRSTSSTPTGRAISPVSGCRRGRSG